MVNAFLCFQWLIKDKSLFLLLCLTSSFYFWSIVCLQYTFNSIHIIWSSKPIIYPIISDNVIFSSNKNNNFYTVHCFSKIMVYLVLLLFSYLSIYLVIYIFNKLLLLYAVAAYTGKSCSTFYQ